LTDIGATFYERCLRILKEVEEAKDLVERDVKEPRGKLRVAGPMSFGMHHLADAVSDYLARYPQMSVELELNDRYVDLVGEGFDLAIRSGVLTDSDLAARKLAPCRTVVCASAQYVERCGVPRTPLDLSGHICLRYTNSMGRQQWRFRLDEAWESPDIKWRLSANNPDALLVAVKAGQGIAALPTFMAYQALSRGELIPLLLGCEMEEPSIYAVYPRNRYLTHRVRSFIDFLVVRFDGVPYWDTALTRASARVMDAA
jgi:DNA-binding transcriptional LysR family regulator